MQWRLAMILACAAWLGACAEEGASYTGVGSGASASTEVHHTSLATLRESSVLAVEGTVSSVVVSETQTVVVVAVKQTLLSASLDAPESTVSFLYVPEAGADRAPFEGEQAIVFLSGTPGQYLVNGGATGRFRVQDGLVHAVASDGVAIPADTDVAGFVALLQTTEPEIPVYTGDVSYGGGY